MCLHAVLWLPLSYLDSELKHRMCSLKFYSPSLQQLICKQPHSQISFSSAPYCTYRNRNKHQGPLLLMIPRNTLIWWWNNHILPNCLISLFLCHFCRHSTCYMYLLQKLLVQSQEFLHWQSGKASLQAAGSVWYWNPLREWNLGFADLLLYHPLMAICSLIHTFDCVQPHSLQHAHSHTPLKTLSLESQGYVCVSGLWAKEIH